MGEFYLTSYRCFLFLGFPSLAAVFSRRFGLGLVLIVIYFSEQGVVSEAEIVVKRDERQPVRERAGGSGPNIKEGKHWQIAKQ